VDLSQQSIVNAITGAFTSGASHGNADIGWDKISGIEGVIGSEYADQIIGSASDDFIEGRGGGDILDGGAGTSDTVSYAQSFGVTVVLGAENVVSNPAGGHAAGDQIKNFENVFGSLFDDSLTGNSASNILTGGYGNDELTGGGGNDTFVYRYASEDGDTIHDFNSGDKIQIVKSGYEISNAVGLNGFRLNNFAIDYFVQNSTGQATKSGHGQFIYNTSNDTLYWDYDGTGIADSVEVAVFSNGYLLKASDFTLV
jgi:Ca2+-binding RTX toxin-like protein